jgi:hypothetical protein
MGSDSNLRFAQLIINNHQQGFTKFERPTPPHSAPPTFGANPHCTPTPFFLHVVYRPRFKVRDPGRVYGHPVRWGEFVWRAVGGDGELHFSMNYFASRRGSAAGMWKRWLAQPGRRLGGCTLPKEFAIDHGIRCGVLFRR